MDKQELAVMIPVLVVFFTGLVVLSRTAIGQALARRIGGDHQAPDDIHQHLLEVQAELQTVRLELAETQERLDFAERLIARHPAAGQVGPSR